MGRREIRSMKILTGRTPHIYGHLMRDGIIDEIITIRNSNEVILTDKLKEHLAITDSYDYSPLAVRLRSRRLWEHVSSRLSELRTVISNWRK